MRYLLTIQQATQQSLLESKTTLSNPLKAHNYSFYITPHYATENQKALQSQTPTFLRLQASCNFLRKNR